MTGITHILIDWGTTSFRLWGVNADGAVLCRTDEPYGMSKLKPSDYEPMLESILAKFDIAETTPVLICGMAGAAQGWQEARYINIPTKLDGLPGQAITVKTSLRPVRILPGLAQRSETHPDVIRGEETLLLGALINGLRYKYYCLPGTHSKWVQVQDGQICQIQTFMTGELFDLLSTRSTLSYFMDIGGESLHHHPGYKTAILDIQSNPELLMNALFSIRAGRLLFSEGDAAAAMARLSGLLIGAELSAVQVNKKEAIGLVAQGRLADFYLTAMMHLDINAELINSEALALSGLKFAADQM